MLTREREEREREREREDTNGVAPTPHDGGSEQPISVLSLARVALYFLWDLSDVCNSDDS